jgi:ATP-dependent protease ClpP protease subunit
MDYGKYIVEYGIDIRNKVIHLHGLVDIDLYDHVVRSLAVLDNAYPDENYDVTVMMSTYGGELYYGFAIYDALKAWGGKVKIICNGPVMSAGTVILQAATHRIMMPNSFLLIHFGEELNTDRQTKHHNNQLDKRMQKLICSSVKVKAKTAKGWFSKESYFDTKRAIDVGLIDRIFGDEPEKSSS